MSETDKQPLDVYRDWLRIEDAERPLNYYQLLRLKRFVDDPGKIRNHYRKLNAHVRKFAVGDYAAESQQLLNELARAMLCLTDAKRKVEYDESLGRVQAVEGRALEFDEILLNSGAISKEHLDKAKQYAEAVGFSLRDALSQQKAASPEAVMQAYAQSVGLPFLDLGDVAIDESLFARISAVLARTHSVAPIMIENDQLLLASPNPLNLQIEEDLRLRLGMPIRMVLCTPVDINRVINEHYPREAVEAEFASRSEQSAEDNEPSGLGKVWSKVKKWVEENNKK